MDRLSLPVLFRSIENKIFSEKLKSFTPEFVNDIQNEYVFQWEITYAANTFTGFGECAQVTVVNNITVI